MFLKEDIADCIFPARICPKTNATTRSCPLMPADYIVLKDEASASASKNERLQAEVSFLEADSTRLRGEVEGSSKQVCPSETATFCKTHAFITQ